MPIEAIRGRKANTVENGCPWALWSPAHFTVALPSCTAAGRVCLLSSGTGRGVGRLTAKAGGGGGLLGESAAGLLLTGRSILLKGNDCKQPHIKPGRQQAACPAGPPSPHPRTSAQHTVRGSTSPSAQVEEAAPVLGGGSALGTQLPRGG